MSSPGAVAHIEVLDGLADPTRRRILDALAGYGSATATTLAGGLPISRQAVVKHLALLDRVGLVSGQRAGREMRYRLRPDRLEAAAHWLAELAGEWDRRLQLIKHIAESAETDPDQ
ncbi:MAG TPA: metalloregulator ArsR/SmtB family transcription factor [Pseudonocardiaceae bacterium]|jgi:DNA-binding transcriptional ArsR family regulator|nr:metalloregulator ArsR/SmtB family transcription factor [Pseudonocardiaceae bacterium]